MRLLGKKTFRRAALGAALLFALLNGAVFVLYQQKTYPNTLVGSTRIGGIGFAGLPDKITGLSLLPADVTVSIQGKSERVSLAQAGITADKDKITRQARARRSWLPILNLFSKQTVPVFITTDSTRLDAELTRLQAKHHKAARDARIALKGTSFSIVDHQNGYELDVPAAKTALMTALEKSQTTATLPTKTLEPKQTTARLTPALQDLQTRQKTAVTYTYAGKQRTMTAAEITAWFEPKGTSYVLSEAKIRSSIIGVGIGLGIGIKNLDRAASETSKALTAKKSLSFALERAPLKQKTFTYCTTVRGVPASHLTGLISKLAAVFGDSRGWGLDGQVVLKRVGSGCDFTVWLTAANQMPAFGAICDANWSCRVGPNVVINFDRWQGASAAWNKKGGSLDDYRSMVINHETGHWFEFGHVNCSGSGQLAPVMQQQSIDLQGCKFNPWPLPSERANLKRSLGL